MKKSKIGYEVKLHNKRVRGVVHDGGNVSLLWLRLDGRALTTTQVTLTRESAEATLALLVNLLKENPR